MIDRNVPRLRFKGFDSEWKKIEIKNCIKHNNLKNKDLSITNVESVSNKRGFIKQTDQFDDYSVASKDLSNYIVIKPGMFAYNPSRINVGSIAFKDNNSLTSVVSPLYVSFKTNNNLSDSFFLQWFNTNSFKHQRNKYSEGGVRDSLSFKILSNMNIKLPDLSEQKYITSFFSKFNCLIDLHSQKLEQLKKLKEGYLQKMFPKKGEFVPRLRFSGFNDDWDSVKVGELLDHNNIRNKDLSITNVESVSNKKGFLKQTDQFEDYSVASKDLSNYIVIKPGMFAYNPSRINVGSIAHKDYNSKGSVVSPLYVSFKTNEKLYDDFLLYWFKTEQFRYQRERYSEGGVRDSLSYKLLASMEFLLPSIQEQKKISTFLSKIDYLIEQQDEKIKSVKDVKKYYLQRMYI